MEVPKSRFSICQESLRAPPKAKGEGGRSSLRRRSVCTSVSVVCRKLTSLQTSDLILMILDATKKAEQRALIEAELEAVGIRLNREPPYEFPS